MLRPSLDVQSGEHVSTLCFHARKGCVCSLTCFREKGGTKREKEGKKDMEGGMERKEGEGRQASRGAQCRPSSVGGSASSLPAQADSTSRPVMGRWAMTSARQLKSSPGTCSECAWRREPQSTSVTAGPAKIHLLPSQGQQGLDTCCTPGFLGYMQVPAEGRIIGVGGRSPQSNLSYGWHS